MDGGSGLRALGKEIIESNLTGLTFHIFLSHLHYDHIQGIPFLPPPISPLIAWYSTVGTVISRNFCVAKWKNLFFQLTLTPWGKYFFRRTYPW